MIARNHCTSAPDADGHHRNIWLAFLVEGIASPGALADALSVSHEALRSLFGAGRCGWRGLTKLAKIHAGDESPDFSLRWA